MVCTGPSLHWALGSKAFEAQPCGPSIAQRARTPLLWRILWPISIHMEMILLKKSLDRHQRGSHTSHQLCLFCKEIVFIKGLILYHTVISISMNIICFLFGLHACVQLQLFHHLCEVVRTWICIPWAPPDPIRGLSPPPGRPTPRGQGLYHPFGTPGYGPRGGVRFYHNCYCWI